MTTNDKVYAYDKKFFASCDLWNRQFRLFCRARDEWIRTPNTKMLRPVLSWVVDEQPNYITAHDADPMLACTTEEAQILIDALWSAGLRPTEGSGSAGSLAATQGHLADMRKIAFNALGVAAP